MKIVLIGAQIVLIGGLVLGAPPDTADWAHVFQVPQMLRAVGAALAGGDRAAIAAQRAAVAAMAARAPQDPMLPALEAEIAAALGMVGGAATAPRRAAEAGASAEATPAPVVDGVAPVGPGNTRWRQDLRLLEARFAFPDRPSRRRLAGARADDSPAARRLARLVASGAAAGNHGDVYDNRDRGHSSLRPDRHPTLAFTRYAEPARQAGVDYGLNDAILFDAPTLGNSSTARTQGPLWRSLPRAAMTRRGGVAALATLYGWNHLYVYPEHRDHDPERGDLFPANTPHLLVSQGSSGSDRAALQALAAIYAAFRPDTKARLAETGLLAPTAQMVFRQGMAGVTTDEAYLSGAAHPSAFPPEGVDLARMIELANAIRPDALPPVARLEAVAEEAPGPPVDPFSDLAAERLFDTPGAVARVALGPAQVRRYVLRGAAREVDGRPVRLVWRVLRGRGVALRPLDPEGATVEATVPWQDAEPVPGRPDLTSRRVDVGLFAADDLRIGPPAFFSVYFPPAMTRTVAPDGRLLAVDHRSGPDPGAYVDPELAPLRPWRDVYDHGPDGVLRGAAREGPEGAVDLCRQGHLVQARDARGRPTEVRPLDYVLGPPGADGRRVVRYAPGGERLIYRYADAADLLGRLEPAPGRGP